MLVLAGIVGVGGYVAYNNKNLQEQISGVLSGASGSGGLNFTNISTPTGLGEVFKILGESKDKIVERTNHIIEYVESIPDKAKDGFENLGGNLPEDIFGVGQATEEAKNWWDKTTFWVSEKLDDFHEGKFGEWIGGATFNNLIGVSVGSANEADKTIGAWMRREIVKFKNEKVENNIKKGGAKIINLGGNREGGGSSSFRSKKTYSKPVTFDSYNEKRDKLMTSLGYQGMSSKKGGVVYEKVKPKLPWEK